MEDTQPLGTLGAHTVAILANDVVVFAKFVAHRAR